MAKHQSGSPNGEPMKKQTQIRKQTSNYQDLWANDMQTGFSPWDFRITFGVIQKGSPEELHIDETATIRMSPQFMVRVVQTMQKSLVKYEDTFGPIQMPKGLEVHEG